jgi:hypothetical protein
MGFALVPLTDAITATVESYLPGYAVYEDTLPDEASITVDPTTAQMVPYIILRYSPLRESIGSGSIAGVRYGDYYATMDIMTCAPAGRMSRQMLDIITDHLLGFNPGGGGEMKLEGGASQFVVSSNEARPTQFVCTVRMRYNVNGNDVGSPMVRP